MLTEQPVERADHAPDCALRTARVLRRVHQNEPMVGDSALIGRVGKPHKVSHVFSHHRPPALLCDGEDCRILG
jgi:hypothetical protein